MGRGRRLLLVAAALVVVSGGVVYHAVAPSSDSATGPIYTVSAVQYGLKHTPKQWIGRTIRIRGFALATCGLYIDGRAMGCTLRPVGVAPFGLVDRLTRHPDADMKRSLPLLIQSPEDIGFWSAFIAHVSLLALFAPHPVPVCLVHYAAVYTVRLQVQSPCSEESLATPCVVGFIGVATTTGY